jgi:hypothetical protein
MADSSVGIIPFIALILGTIGLGGGIYETLLVDKVWPGNLAIIQPQRGGLDRKRFWIPVHSLYEIALLVSAWDLSKTDARPWIIIALIAHFAARIWSFAYFIPMALRFEQLSEFDELQARLARRWTRLSPCRLILEAVSVIALGATVLFGATR